MASDILAIEPIPMPQVQHRTRNTANPTLHIRIKTLTLAAKVGELRRIDAQMPPATGALEIVTQRQLDLVLQLSHQDRLCWANSYSSSNGNR